MNDIANDVVNEIRKFKQQERQKEINLSIAKIKNKMKLEMNFIQC